MFDPDSLVLILLAFIVITLLLAPPGPGTPLRAPTR